MEFSEGGFGMAAGTFITHTLKSSFASLQSSSH